MTRFTIAAVLALLIATPVALAQQAEPAIEAKKEVVVTWTMGDQTWDFKAVQGAYEPIKGNIDTARNEARWTFQIVKDLEPGTAALHSQTKGTPFRPIMLNADRLVMANDGRVEMTESTGKAGDRIEVYFQLPAPDVWQQVKSVRVERRTNVGF